MFGSCSWPFPLLPSCLPIVPPDIVHDVGNLSHYWGTTGALPLGNELEHVFGHLKCPQGHDLLNTLEFPTLYGAAVEY
jgi:hypothetical protein